MINPQANERVRTTRKPVSVQKIFDLHSRDSEATDELAEQDEFSDLGDEFSDDDHPAPAP